MSKARKLSTIPNKEGASSVGYLPAGIGAVERSVESKLRESVSVKDFGAVCNGTTDDSAAVNAAIAAVHATGGGVVVIPAPAIRLSNVLIKHGVILRGAGRESTTVYVTDIVNPAFKLEDYAGLEDLRIYYPNQVTNGTPTAYPASITHAITGAGYSAVRRVALQGSYDGIVIGDAIYGVSKFTVEDVVGFPLRYGIKIDNNLDVLRVVNCHFNPNIYGGYGSSLLAWTYQNGTALSLARCDGPQVTNFHCFGYATGCYGSIGSPSGSVNMGIFTNCMFDICRNPLTLANYQYGVLFTNCIFTTGGSNYNGVTGGVVTIGTNNSTVAAVASFINCSFRTFNADIIHSSTHCEFTNCQFDDFNIAVGSYAVLRASYAANDVKFLGCYADSRGRAGSAGIISSAAINLTLTGNTFANFSGAQIANVTGNLYASDNNLSGTAYTWNGVVCMDINGVLCTYQTPSAFTVTAAFQHGARFGNYVPAIGQPKGWSCTASGTPGTWVSEGNL